MSSQYRSEILRSPISLRRAETGWCFSWIAAANTAVLSRFSGNSPELYVCETCSHSPPNPHTPPHIKAPDGPNRWSRGLRRSSRPFVFFLHGPWTGSTCRWTSSTISRLVQIWCSGDSILKWIFNDYMGISYNDSAD